MKRSSIPEDESDWNVMKELDERLRILSRGKHNSSASVMASIRRWV